MLSVAVHGVSNGNRTEWSPIRSVIIRVINKTQESDLFNHEYDYDFFQNLLAFRARRSLSQTEKLSAPKYDRKLRYT